MVKLDLHTHSDYSDDGGLTLADYRALLTDQLDMVAVTDHNTTLGAQRLRKSLGERIIVGSEISSAEGEIVGLFLTQDVPPGLSVAATVKHIHDQGGLVLIPHPFERWQRFSLYPDRYPKLIDQFDIIETYNSRSLSISGPLRAVRFANKWSKPQAACSDAHGPGGAGRAYCLVKSRPNRDNLLQLLHSADYAKGRAGLRGYLEPRKNRRQRAKIGKSSRG